jgi:SAM-dependent methyltransferase
LSREVLEVLQVKEMTKGTRELFDYSVCARCGSLYICRFPDDIARYYEGYYSLAGGVAPLEKSAIRKALVAIYSVFMVRSGLSALVGPAFRNPSAWQMKFISPNLQALLFAGARAADRILDVGCGRGQFVEVMNRFGYANATGIDPFLNDRDERERVRRSDIRAVSGTYHLVLFNHSLEHMTGPEAAIGECARILAPGGLVLVQVPNVGSREFTRFKQHWCWLHAPYHFAIPSRNGIETMAGRCGFKVVDAICTSRADHYLYSDEYARDIPDCDPGSARRALEAGSFDKGRFRALARLAYSLNKRGSGDWICYYLRKSG